jgi:hypothetical protein
MTQSTPPLQPSPQQRRPSLPRLLPTQEPMPALPHEMARAEGVAWAAADLYAP